MNSSVIAHSSFAAPSDLHVKTINDDSRKSLNAFEEKMKDSRNDSKKLKLWLDLICKEQMEIPYVKFPNAGKCNDRKTEEEKNIKLRSGSTTSAQNSKGLSPDSCPYTA